MTGSETLKFTSVICIEFCGQQNLNWKVAPSPANSLPRYQVKWTKSELQVDGRSWMLENVKLDSRGLRTSWDSDPSVPWPCQNKNKRVILKVPFVSCEEIHCGVDASVECWGSSVPSPPVLLYKYLHCTMVSLSLCSIDCSIERTKIWKTKPEKIQNLSWPSAVKKVDIYKGKTQTLGINIKSIYPEQCKNTFRPPVFVLLGRFISQL